MCQLTLNIKCVNLITKEGVMEKRKATFAGSFTTVSLIMVLIVSVIMTLLFFIYLRIVVINLTELSTRENVAHSREMILSALKEHECTLDSAAVGIAHFFRHQMFTSDIKSYLYDMNEKLPNSLDIYFTNNHAWNQQGGFSVFATGWVPEDDWDNTTRPWFTEAKREAGRIAYSKPYVDADTGDVVVTLSKTVFQSLSLSGLAAAQMIDIGVIANDVTVNNLGEIINMMKNYQGQEIYIINSEGFFITHEDINAVMKNSFFTDKNLERYSESILSGSDMFKIDRRVLIYSSVIPHTDWILVTTIPSSVIFSRTDSITLRLIFFCALMFACVSFISIIYAHKKFTVPLNNVVKITDALAARDYNIDITAFNNNEIGDIQVSLIKIRDSLKSNIDSLNQHLSNEENKE